MNRHSYISMNRTKAFTLLELSVAAALIAALLVTTLQMLRALEDFRKTSRRRAYAQQAVAAVAEQAANVGWSELNSAAANNIAIPVKLRPYLSDGKLAVAVTDETAPTAKRISVEMTWAERSGRVIAPVRLTTWVFPDEIWNP
jgi:type II secretory pathway pseudopilin PulG